LKLFRVENETSVRILLRAWCEVHELEHRRCTCVVRELVVHRRGERVVRV
jgi:hypothetical protein